MYPSYIGPFLSAPKITQDLNPTQLTLSVTPPYETSLEAQLVKNPPAMQETWVRFLGWEDSLEKEMGTHSSILPGKSHGQRSMASVLGVSRVRHDLATKPPPPPPYLEDCMASHSSILAWRIPMNRGAWQATTHGKWQATIHGVAKSWTWLNN